MNGDNAPDLRSALFKGCTRPPMVMGIPMTPFFLVVLVAVAAGVFINLLLIFLAVPVLMVMRAVAKADDQQFRLIYMKLLFRVAHLNKNGKFWNASSYSPVTFTKRKG